MRRFQFSLHTALSLREQAVEVELSRLRAVQQQWNANLMQQQALTAELRTAEMALREGSEEILAGGLAELDSYRAAARRKRVRLAREASEISKRLAERQSALRSAERALALLTRLKEQARMRWQHEFDKEQQQLAEEAYLSRWNAK